jgi:hypothetical protein
MDSVVFRAALRASAKVALTASLSACGGAVQTTTSSETPDAFADTSSGTVLGEGAAPSDAGRAANACAPPPVASLLPEQNHPDAAVADETFGCCVRMVAASFEQPEGGFQPMLTDAAVHDPTVLGCCAAVVVRLDSDYSATLAAQEQDRAELTDAGLGQGTYDPAGCCEALSSQLALYPSGPTCSPWGPPMPPAMPDVA